MPTSTSSLACLFTFLLFVSILQAHETALNVNGAGPDRLHGKIDCGRECRRRCKLASRHKMCLRACGTCCARCHCVPLGTSGNQDACPCYATITTHHGRKKCP